MRRSSILSLLLITILSFGLIFSSKAAYAHNFGSDESALYLAKVQEVPIEAHYIQSDIGNATLVRWHVDKIGEYWTSYDNSQIAERNQLLAKEITGSIANLTSEATKTNPDPALVKQIVDNLDGYIAESVSVRIDQQKLQNLSVSALAIKAVTDEIMNDYGNATGSGSSMSSMSMSSGGSMGSMSSMSNSSNQQPASMIVNIAAYQSTQGLATAAQNMWNDLKAKTPSNASSTAISNLDKGFIQLEQYVDNKASNDQVMGVIHGVIHSNLQIAYGLQVAPEFPAPLLLTVVSVAGVIAVARFRLKHWRKDTNI